jgi:hypothetical protein
MINQRNAIEMTIHFAYENRAKLPTRGPCSYEHLLRMAIEVRRNRQWDEGKIGRWLGWMQCALAIKLAFGDVEFEEKYLKHFSEMNKLCE